MLKLAGLVLLVLFCSLGGIWLGGTLHRRTAALKKTQLFLHMLCERLRYTLSPVEEIFAQLRAEPLLEELDFIAACSDEMAAGTPFPEAFQRGVDGCRCALDEKDRRLLGELCGIVGASDVENQLEGLSLVRANLAQQAAQAGEAAQKRAKLYASLGVLSGLGLAVVLI